MNRISFKNDYSEGCHPRILDALQQLNLTQNAGYGLDQHCVEAAEKIIEEFGTQNSTVHFVTGGTQANLLCISSFLRPHECVIATEESHIYNNETGAIEATGHKIIPVKRNGGKISQESIAEVLRSHSNIPHQVKPRLVFISNATELGTVYTKNELIDLKKFCEEHELLLYMDGARLAQAITAETNDIPPKYLGELTDAFYFGGTKNGLLFGEAIVINNPLLQNDFEFMMKQKGALLAKSSVIGNQFATLMKNGFYKELAQNANFQAQKIAKELKLSSVAFLSDSPTNQIFPILDLEIINKLSEKFDFYIWKNIDKSKAAIRLITSWATTDEMTQSFIHEFRKSSKKD